MSKVTRREVGGPASRWSTRWARRGDDPSLLALFERSFGSRMDEALWRWKYQRAVSPGVVCCHGDEIIAFNGGMPRSAQIMGTPHEVVQMGDVMVDPGWRGVLTRRGPFYRVVQHFFAESVGEALPFRYAFGFPHARHARLGRTLKLYCDTDRIEEASWSGLSRRRLATTATPLRTAHAATVDKLWDAMAADAAALALGRRDWAWLNQRYLSHPHRPYQAWLVISRVTRRALGVVVLRVHEAAVELIDLLGARRAMPALVATARHLCVRLNRQRLFAWVTPSTAEWLASSEPKLAATEVVIPGSRVNGLALGLEVQGRWWLMGGDSDFR